MTDKELLSLRERLKSGNYDGVDIMLAWMVVDELLEIKQRGLSDQEKLSIDTYDETIRKMADEMLAKMQPLPSAT